MVMDGIDVRSPITGAAASPRTMRPPRRGEVGVAPHGATPGVQALLEAMPVGLLAGGRAAVEADPSGVDPGAELAEHGGQQGEGGGQDGHDREHDAQRHGPERRGRHEQDGGQGGQHGEGGEGDGLAGGVHGLGDRVDRGGSVAGGSAAAVQGGPEADHQEQGVVDAQAPGRTSSAKLSAQIDTGATLSARTKAPAATSRPAMVNMSGRPAATRLPKAMTRMTRVTGHDSSSERIMAEWLARVEVGPQGAVTGQGHRDRRGTQMLQGSREMLGGDDHGVGVRGGAGGDDPGPPVSRQ